MAMWRAARVPAAGASDALLALLHFSPGRCWQGAGLRWMRIRVLRADRPGLLQQHVLPVETLLSLGVLCTHPRSLSEDGLSHKREGKERLQGLGGWRGPGSTQLRGRCFQDMDAWALAAGESGAALCPPRGSGAQVSFVFLEIFFSDKLYDLYFLKIARSP